MREANVVHQGTSTLDELLENISVTEHILLEPILETLREDLKGKNIEFSLLTSRQKVS